MESIGNILNKKVVETLERAYANALETPDVYKDNYNCDLCKDVGVIYHQDNKRTWGEVCPCKSKQRELYNLKIAGIEEDRTINDFEIEIYKDQFYMEGIKLIIEDFIYDHKGKNLFLTGNTGLGKTHASKIIAAEMVRKGIDTLYVRASKLLDELMTLKMTAMEDYPKKQEKLEDVEILILDDIGTETLSESKLTELFNLIDERQIKGKSTVISSNLPLTDMEAKYNERIVSRIKGYYQILQFKGKDLRYGK